jgi:nicotinamidase-related amidase
MDFAKSALIVVDINRTHFDMELNYLPVPPEDAKRVIDKVSQVVIPQFRLHKRPIIYIKTAHRINPLTGEAMSVASPYWRYQMERRNVTGVGQKRKALAVEGSKVTEIMPELEVRPEDLIVVKQRYSPFVGTDLERILSVMNIDTLFLVGANTNNCVLSTAFEAFNRDFGVLIDLPFTHQDMADLIKSSRVSVSKIFREFTDMGIIKKEKGRYIICDLQQLENIVNKV